MLKAKFACKRASALLSSPISSSETVRVFVGEECREFVLSKKALSSTSEYFADRLDASSVNFVQRNAQLNTLWLEELCPEMFELFAYWLDERGGFQGFIDEAEANDCCEDLQWDLITLHLFAARIGLDALQDAAMDGIQDIYLRLDWDITPKFVSQIYAECDPVDSYRLRKWIVAMAAWSLGGCVEKIGTADKMGALFQACPEFWHDYVAHLSKSSKSKIKLAFKNPQLRLPSNNLRNDERQFGFRQCSFHTHRSSVGQGRCPHAFSLSPSYPYPPVQRPESPLTEEDSDLELGSITGKALVASPRTAIFDLYLDLD
ncbi:hypothetical protein JX265_005302 [Neoarthrinium moseri]|uniref:BTB domain-containing protein n=1 Tax=Neoarthrinium moseri TaxID=1658444 RepID=A0A9P9WNP6_9PEZI|nr:hypothetical protein JX265_005302 [Neoarthrinium moseri]